MEKDKGSRSPGRPLSLPAGLHRTGQSLRQGGPASELGAGYLGQPHSKSILSSPPNTHSHPHTLSSSLIHAVTLSSTTTHCHAPPHCHTPTYLHPCMHSHACTFSFHTLSRTCALSHSHSCTLPWKHLHTHVPVHTGINESAFTHPYTDVHAHMHTRAFMSHSTLTLRFKWAP